MVVLPGGEAEFLDIFLEAYSSIMRYPRASDGFWVCLPARSAYVDNVTSFGVIPTV
jgi:hypothetical protein